MLAEWAWIKGLYRILALVLYLTACRELEECRLFVILLITITAQNLLRRSDYDRLPLLMVRNQGSVGAFDQCFYVFDHNFTWCVQAPQSGWFDAMLLGWKKLVRCWLVILREVPGYSNFQKIKTGFQILLPRMRREFRIAASDVFSRFRYVTKSLIGVPSV